MGYTVFGIDGIAPTLTAATSRHYERYKVGDQYRRLTMWNMRVYKVFQMITALLFPSIINMPYTVTLFHLYWWVGCLIRF